MSEQSQEQTPPQTNSATAVELKKGVRFYGILTATVVLAVAISIALMPWRSWYAEYLIGVMVDKSNHPNSRNKAMYQLAELGGKQSQEAVPVYLAIINDVNDDTHARQKAHWHLTRIDAVATVEVAIQYLQQQEPVNEKVRRGVFGCLMHLGPLAKDAVPTLITILDDPNEDPPNKYLATQILGNIGPDAKQAVPAMSAYLRNVRNDEYHRRAAIESIGNLGPAAASAAPLLIEILTDKTLQRDEYTRWLDQESIIETLGKIGPASKDAVPILIGMIQGDSKYGPVQEAAGQALARIGLEQEHAGALRAFIQDGNTGTIAGHAAAYALTSFEHNR